MSETIAPPVSLPVAPAFDDPGIAERLEMLPAEAIDALPFGVIGMDLDGTVVFYSARESAFAGLSPARVLGRHMFEDVGPCMNTDRVAGRFETVEELDEFVPFILTLRMRPTPVTLRLIKRVGQPRLWLLLERKPALAAA